MYFRRRTGKYRADAGNCKMPDAELRTEPDLVKALKRLDKLLDEVVRLIVRCETRPR
jgi:hypothetical protein